VVDRPRARPGVLRGAPEIGLLVLAGLLRARADVNHVAPVQVQPVDGKAEIRMRTFLHAEDGAVPVPGLRHVGGGDQVMLDVRQRHAVLPGRGSTRVSARR